MRKIAFFLLFSTIANIHAQVWYLFSHGLRDSKEKAYDYIETYKIGNKTHHNPRCLIKDPVVTFNYPDVLKYFPRIDTRKTSLGQDNEIKRLAEVYKDIVQNTKDKREDSEIVIFGLSRGASTGLNFVARHNPPAVKALVLESPFDKVETVVDNKFEQLWLLKWVPQNFRQYITENIYWRYKKDGVCPIDEVSKIRKDLPILIICTKEDELVPCHSSLKLYDKLKESGHTATHLFIADHGKHAKILQGPDGDSYQAAVHAFYKKYGFPHNPEFARQGREYLR